MRRCLLFLALLGCDGDTSGGSPDVSPPAPDVGTAPLDAAPPMLDAAPPPIPDMAPPPAPDVASPPSPDAGAPPPAVEAVVPLGETLFLDGDDYLADWAGEGGIEVVDRPEGGSAAIVEARLTPDATGLWVLRRGEHEARVEVRDDTLTPDTFLNFNYSPTTPLALDPDGAALWVASPPSNAVARVGIGPHGATPDVLVPTGSWPTAVAVWGDYLLVAQTGRDSLGFLHLPTRRLEDAIHVGNEPAGIVVDDARGLAYVSLSGEDRVARVDLAARALVDRVDVGRDPRAMARLGDRLFVASLISDNATPRGLSEPAGIPHAEQRDVAVIALEDFTVTGWVLAAGTILRGLWVDPTNPERLVVAQTDADNLQTNVGADSRPHHHALRLVDTSTLRVDGQVDLDLQASSSGPAPSPFTVGAPAEGDFALVTLSAGKAVLVVDRETFAERGRVEAGHDPRGLVFAHGRAWTYAWLDNAVQSWPLTATGLDADGFDSAEVGADPTPPDVKEGQRIFADANFSRHRDFACNSCHIDGLTDGLVWNLLLDGDVNTLAFRNVGGTDPFLWNGALPTLFDFSREVLRLVGAQPGGEHLRFLTTYLQSVTAPPNPFAGPGGRHTPLAERGREVFFTSVEAGGAGCLDCHDGPAFTGRFRIQGKTPGVDTDVPSLIGVYDTGPWGRMGQWRTLDAMVDFAVEFTGAELSRADRAALRRFVSELPGDRLYLNSARPLKGAVHVHYQTPVELSFSAVLKAGQADLFQIVQVGADDAESPLPGAWAASGRYVRFTPEGGDLPLTSQFRITVEDGLRSTLGQRLEGPVDIEFETGDLPDFDISGLWSICLFTPFGEGCGEAQFVQTAGGRVSGNLVRAHELFDIDHMGGHVSGDTFYIEPFIAQTNIAGDIQIDDGEAALTGGDMGDFAEVAEGELRAALGVARVRMERLAYPRGN